MAQPKRTRAHNVCIRMNDAEYEQFLQKVKDSGQTQQSFVLNAISNTTIATPETVNELRLMNQNFEEASKLFRGTATNLNQIAHNTNLLVDILQDEHPDETRVDSLAATMPDQAFIEQLAKYVLKYRKDIEAIWRSLRQSTNTQKLMRVSETSSNTSSGTTK